MDRRCMTQIELAERWQISEATLERWRTEAGGPLFLKLGNQLRYRAQDVEAFETEMLRASTKPHGEVIQSQPEAPAQPTARRPQAINRPIRPVTIWLRTGSRSTRLRPLYAARTLPR
jgi:hypothetical protein